MRPSKPLVLLIVDGWGLREGSKGNAIALAKTPNYSELLSRFPHTSLEASGTRVGLPAGQMGNSEVGHMNMGAGRVVYQDLTRIDKAIVDGDLDGNEALVASMDRCHQSGRALHLVGLLSDGGVHSHQHHLYALLELAKRRGLTDVFVHALTDGRDTSPTAGIRYVSQLEAHAARVGVGRIATLSGRYFAMDRDNRWERTQRTVDALVHGIGATGQDARQVLERSYAQGTTDEFLEPTVLLDAEGQPVGPIRAGDSVICFNFRADRVRQLTRALALADFLGFERRAEPDVHYTCMTEYDETFGLPVVFARQTFGQHLGEVLGNFGVSNLRLAETEKYAHVTYFFNCGQERPYPGEDRLLIPSPKVPTYDLQPEMSAPLIADALVEDLRRGAHPVIICNFANADMVGHTGNLPATIAAVETLDRCLGRIIEAVRSAGGTAIVTSDHGNCEQMWDDQLQSPHTAHTSNPVPLILVGEPVGGPPLRAGGALCDVAPTILALLSLDQPAAMTGRDLRDW
jgi:2,3-bisphosphoglycerate-independent phosphoglycerate mutase